MHKVGIAHTDLKPENILIKDNHIKITGYGYSKFITSHENLEKCSRENIYMDPIVSKSMSYSNKCDMWSLGVILY